MICRSSSQGMNSMSQGFGVEYKLSLCSFTAFFNSSTFSISYSINYRLQPLFLCVALSIINIIVSLMEDRTKAPRFNRSELPNFRQELDEYPDSFTTRFVNIISDNFNRLFSQVFGSAYTPLNNFSTVQKQKILDYLFAKNIMTILQLEKSSDRKKFFRETGYPEGTTTKEKLSIEKKKLSDSDDRVESLQLIRKQLRSYYVNEMSYELNRARYVSMSYGFMVGVCIVLTIMKPSTPTRKLFACVTFAHVFGQFSIYRKMDYVFDQLYPLFQEDVKNALAQNQLQQFEGENLKKLLKTLKL